MSKSLNKQKSPTAHDQIWLGALLKGLIVLFSWLPLSLNRKVGQAIGLFLWWLPNSNKRIAQRNIRVAFPSLSDTKQRALVKQSLMQLGQATTELGPVWCWTEQKLLSLIKEVKGRSLLDEALARNQGVIFLAPHIGSWELIGTFLSANYPSTFLYRPPNVASVESFMVKARGRFGAQLAPTNVRGVRTLIKALKNNEVTVILPDQDPGAQGGVYAPFFGRPARTMTLASKLIQKTDCAYLFMMVERLPGASGYRLHFLPADKAIASEDELVATTALNNGVAQCILRCPEQYLWSYKRYRHPPAGIEDIYR